VKNNVHALALALLLGGCSGSATPGARSEAAAERAYGAGRYDEAAEQWRLAEHASTRPAERDEARYRRAVCLARAGHFEQAHAVLSELLRDSPHGERSARAASDRALISIEHGEAAAGYTELDDVIRAYPDAGVAPSALKRYLDWLRRGRDGTEKVRAYLSTLSSLERSELGEYILYYDAEALEESGDLAGARTAFAHAAERHPYPAGVLWDDAIWKAAELDVQLGDVRLAISRLQELLSHRETAYVQGSYERGRYAEAQFRIAELYRDRLDDPRSARTAFERVWSDHPTSRLRDDAKWSAARLAMSLGDAPAACRDLEELARALPTSRYVPCAPRLCPSMRPSAGANDCHDYVVRGTQLTAGE
jgi:tetratricopeptide (TPR) repeat protein